MREFNVLFGFKSQKIEEAITKELQAMGYHVNATMRFSKQLISDYVNSHPELDAVVLKEYLDGGGKYSTRELAELVDNVFVNVVIVLEQKHRGRESAKELYSAGILNAFFADGKFGVNPDKLADACVNSRTRAQAREYYRIKETVVNYDRLVYEEFLDCYRYLLNKEYGVNIMDRFVTITRWLSPMQMASFILTVPESVTEILKGYDEYYDVCWKLYKLGCLETKLRKTRQTKKGLNPGVFQEELKGTRKKGHGKVELTGVSTSRLDSAPAAAPRYEVEGDIMEMDPRPLNDRSGAPDIYAYADGLSGQMNEPPEKKLSRKEKRELKKAEKLRKKEERTGILPDADEGDSFEEGGMGPVLSIPPQDAPQATSAYGDALPVQAGSSYVQDGGNYPGQQGAAAGVQENMPSPKEPDLSSLSVEELIELYGK